MSARPRGSLAARFWARVQKGEGCWLWTGAVSTNGYGAFGRWHGDSSGAHRTAYELAFGEIPPGLFVCHRCDVKRCVRPDHLFLGTHADNMADRNAKGRQARGEKSIPHTLHRGQAHPNSKLTGEQVLEIRRLRSAGAAVLELASRFSVSKSLIHNVTRGPGWRHL